MFAWAAAEGANQETLHVLVDNYPWHARAHAKAGGKITQSERLPDEVALLTSFVHARDTPLGSAATIDKVGVRVRVVDAPPCFTPLDAQASTSLAPTAARTRREGAALQSRDAPPPVPARS